MSIERCDNEATRFQSDPRQIESVQTRKSLRQTNCAITLKLRPRLLKGVKSLEAQC